MDFKELTIKAKEIRDKYAEKEKKLTGRTWSVLERTQGFVGDVGDLTKLVMAKKGLRKIENLDKKLTHELADCLWSVIIISDELGIDLEKSFLDMIEDLNQKVFSSGQ